MKLKKMHGNVVTTLVQTLYHGSLEHEEDDDGNTKKQLETAWHGGKK